MLVRHFLDEYGRYRAYGEKAMAQISDEALNHVPVPDGNSLAMIVRHVTGNLRARFTDFLGSDGEKPWRDRENEFAPGTYTREEITTSWREAFELLERELGSIPDSEMSREVTIRGVALTVHEALCRSLSHVAMHVGQIVLLSKIAAGAEWKTLSIPRGGSAAYNANPIAEKAAAHAAALNRLSS
jgi:hypothetical protein